MNDINDLFNLHEHTKFNKISQIEDFELLNEIKKLATMYAIDQLNNLNKSIDNKRSVLSDLLKEEIEDSVINRLKYKISGLGIAKEEIRRLINDIKDSNE
jgi:hypothetical protein